MAEKPKTQRVETPCRCGNNAISRVGTVEHNIGHTQILIHNIPHYYCPFCKRTSYDINMKVIPVLKNAYRNDITEIDWESH